MSSADHKVNALRRERFDGAPSSAPHLGRFFSVVIGAQQLLQRVVWTMIRESSVAIHDLLMIEPPELAVARKHLSQAEAALLSKNAIFHFEEGLALLQEVVDTGDPQARTLARNIGKTYASKVYDAIRALVAADPNVPEPQLEHLFKIMLTFDTADLELPSDSREVKVKVGRELLNRYLEGHAAEEKRAALEELMRIAGGSDEESELSPRRKVRKARQEE